MDTLTHALSGALLARATEPESPRPDQLPRRARMWVGFWAAAFPDSDFILNFIDPLTYLTAHRGVTHSIVMLPLWALGLGLALAYITRRKYSWRAFAGVVALGIGAHIVGDVITAFGTMIFAPLSDMRVALPTTFIIDPIFSAILVAGLAASGYWPASRRPALIAFAVLGAYVGLQAVLYQRALSVGETYAASHGLHAARAEAIPQPFSPFHWMVVISQEDAYHLSYVSLVRDAVPAQPPPDSFWLRHVYASYYPVAEARWTRIPRFGTPAETELAHRALDSEALAPYRRFALFPALYRIDRFAPGDPRPRVLRHTPVPGAPRGMELCVWFHDLRFALVGRSMPFRYGACREDAQTPWKVYRLIGGDDGREFPDAIP